VPPYDPTSRTEPPSFGGDCQCRGDDCTKPNVWDWDWKCYRHEMPLAYTDAWTQVAYAWGDFTRSKDGYSVEPAALTGVHLKELVQMEWMSEHKGSDSASFDLYVDEVRFF
jgi:hypothetical protein